ncbi:MAG TPA: alpha-amylase family protein [Isosphaeraceae bacterium]|nr:alpha-amylase family protein [Isosphaeraceae bacterium]
MFATGKWYESAYRRAVIDMHIPDWDDRFLAEFDSDRYVQMLVQAQAQSVVAYGQSHVGLFYYPTKVGQAHKSLRGRNLLGEVIDRCHDRGIAVVVYTSLIFDRWAADNRADWRMMTHDGKPHGAGGRHGLVCPNSPYRDYVRAFAEEICAGFDFDGLRFDMTFWPALCFCTHCRLRFRDEVGGDLPRTIDWTDERWVAFQRKRQEWLVEFAGIATDAVRTNKPKATVEHQSSTYPLNWMFGVTSALVSKNDFLQGDFYGDAIQGSFVRKLLESLTPHRPFGYETSVKVELRNHTAIKSQALLEAKASAAIGDASAFIFIDGIDPAGTLDHRVYERMGRVFGRLMPYYAHLGGERVRDVGIYYSFESKFNPSAGQRPVSQPDTSDSHTEAAMQVARRLIGGHLPFGVITKQSLGSLADLKVLLLPAVTMMDEEEVVAIRAWVRGGGTVYASGGTSLCDKRGRLQKEFMLADVFGISLIKPDWGLREHYLAPTAAGEPLFGDFNARYPAFATGYSMEVEARPGATVLATTTLPWPAPDPSRFASIHSNPPWRPTSRPELVLNTFGAGRAIYSASVLETIPELSTTFLSLVRLLHKDYCVEAKAPECVELTIFHQPDRHRYILCIVNFQSVMPNIPVDGVEVTLRLAGARVRAIRQLPGLEGVEHQERAGTISFTAPRLHTLLMFAIETE